MSETDYYEKYKKYKAKYYELKMQFENNNNQSGGAFVEEARGFKHDEVDGKIACSCASTFNRDSYYIDIDFDCDEISALNAQRNLSGEGGAQYYDIYGSATAPEICNLPSLAQETPFDQMVPATDEECEDNQE